MKYFFFIILVLALKTSMAQEPANLKIEFPGCPENAFCTKETGAHRKEWLELLNKFDQKLIDEKEANKIIQTKLGMPVTLWATEGHQKRPLVLSWDSPCKQHNIATNKTFIAITYLKKLLDKNNILFHANSIIIDEKQIAHSIQVLRGDAPMYIINDSLYYIQDDDGHFYGILIAPNGQLSITKVFTDNHYPREVTCTKEQVERFTREAPSPNFFKGYYCKEIWNTKLKMYQSLILGWSCN